MKFTLIFASLLVSVSARPFRRDVDSSLIPEFGATAGVNPDGTGNCDGAVTGSDGKPVQVPCTCPPDRDLFIADLNANVAAGHCVNNTVVAATFPTDDSQASQEARINTALVTLQNLFGAGVGCPASSTTFLAQLKAVQDGTSTSSAAGTSSSSSAAAGNSTSSTASAKASSVVSSAAATTTNPTVASSTAAAASSAAAVAAPSSSSTASASEVASLAPDLGATAGNNPDGTGNCDGAVDGADGKPILVPCSCPPDNATYIASLQANVAAGFAVNNTAVAVQFPTDDSSASLATRINAALVTLQNLEGSGKGCPASSTTLLAQLKSAQSAA